MATRVGVAAALALALVPAASAYDNGFAPAGKPIRGWSTWCTDECVRACA